MRYRTDRIMAEDQGTDRARVTPWGVRASPARRCLPAHGRALCLNFGDPLSQPFGPCPVAAVECFAPKPGRVPDLVRDPVLRLGPAHPLAHVVDLRRRVDPASGLIGVDPYRRSMVDPDA